MPRKVDGIEAGFMPRKMDGVVGESSELKKGFKLVDYSWGKAR